MSVAPSPESLIVLPGGKLTLELFATGGRLGVGGIRDTAAGTGFVRPRLSVVL